MNIQDRLARRAEDDITYIGELARQFLNSEAGVLFQALINGRKSQELTKRGSESADRVLGRLEALETILGDFERCVQDMHKLVSDRQLIEEEEQDIAEEPNPQKYKGQGLI